MNWNLTAIFHVLCVGFFGWFCAGIINYISNSLPQNGSLSVPVCTTCTAQQSFLDILLLKRCPYCQNSPGARSWMVLFTIPIFFVYVYLFSPSPLGIGISSLLIVFFAIVFVIDVEYREIYTIISLFGGIICFYSGWKLHGVSLTLWGGAAGYAIMFALYWLGVGFNRLIEKTRNIEMSEVALGYGDVTLSGVLGLALGFPGIAYTLLLAILLGGLFAGIMLLVSQLQKNYQPFSAMPYAPFLLIGASFLLFIV